ncbi:unnamed protein product [Porites lobata]|uniref:Uncharacterized protein n=1 Tax=Porites lobata TaxID=104759 RepID=A0ABN8R992_9CNID|nr:unnamed protein product [Porites lobata]
MEGFSRGEVDRLFSALVLPNFTDGLTVFGARMDIRELLEKADKKLSKKKETKYQLRNKTAHRPEIETERFKNVFYC